MGVLQNIVKGTMVTGPGYSLGHSISNPVTSVMGSGGARINVIEEYSGYAWKAIEVRSRLLSSEDLYVERFVNKQWQEDPNHEFNLVLEGSNIVGSRDQSELLEAHEKSLCLYGESFWYFSNGEKRNKPFGVYLLDPSCMTVFVANDRITGYEYHKNSTHILFDVDEIDFYRYENPATPFRGMGPMQAAGWFVRSSRYILTYVNNFLENNAIPAGVVVAKGAVDDSDWELFKQQWTSKYSGIDNSGKTGFIRGEDLDFVKTGLSLGEVDFDKVKASSREDIMLMFGVSNPMLGIFTDINRASATTARQLAALTLTEPALMSLRRKLTRRVATAYGAMYRVGSTNPVPEDDDAKLALYEKGTNRWVTVNEARSAYGLPPIKGGDEIVQSNAVPPSESKSFLVHKTADKVVVKLKNKNEEFREQTEKLQLSTEEAIYKRLIPVLKNQEARVIEQINPKKAIDARFDQIDEADKMASEIIVELLGMAEAQGALAAEFAGGASFEMTPVIEKYIKDSVAKAALGFTEDTQAYISQALADGLAAGEGKAEIATRIGTIYNDVYDQNAPGYRLDRIARTESIKTSNEITETAYRQSGVVSKKEWYNNPGACTHCQAMNGTTVNLGSSFLAKDEPFQDADGSTLVNSYETVFHPPLHAQCRCTLLPVIQEI